MSTLEAKRIALESGLVEQCVEAICASSDFRRSERLKRFLRYIVAEKLAGQDARLKAYSIALAVFDRPTSFDAQIDPVVRIEAGRLRRALERYYHAAGRDDPLVITVPRGAYVPRFELRRDGRGSPDDDSQDAAEGVDSLGDPLQDGGDAIEVARDAIASKVPRVPRTADGPWRWALAALGLSLIIGAMAAWALGAAPTASTRTPPLVAVTPFVGALGDEKAARIAQGLSEELIDRLAASGEFRTLGREAARQAPDGDLVAAWARYKVRYAIEGSVLAAPGGGLLTARLVDARSGQVLWSERHPIPSQEGVAAIQADLASRLSEAIGRALAAGPRRM